MNNNPIGIFDSGIGGLTVAKAIVNKLPSESIIYLGDTARVPYGTRSKDIITKFALELVDFLLKREVKCLVVACNTISSVALEEIKKVSPVPVVGVVQPAVKRAVSITKNKKIGIIGTTGTIGSRAYEAQIKKMDSGIEVASAACPLFVPLAEEGFKSHEATKLIATDYLKGVIAAGMDTLILGCTHYPLLKETIAGITGENITLIDSAEPTAEILEKILRENDLQAQGNPSYEFYVTDAPEKVVEVAGRFFGKGLDGNISKINLQAL